MSDAFFCGAETDNFYFFVKNRPYANCKTYKETKTIQHITQMCMVDAFC